MVNSNKGLFLAAILTAMTSSSIAQFLPLYGKAKIPNHTGAPNKESEATTNGVMRISAVSEPSYRFFSAGNEGGAKPCIVVCPGGGYSILALVKEGTGIAEFFNKLGVHVLVLKYRIPASSHQVDKKYAPLQDAQQAIYLARKNAKKWGVDPDRVGIIGFSAGGHVASSLAVHYNDVKIKNRGKLSLRPDFQVLVYPVISFGKFAHGGSRRNLLAPDTTAEMIRYFSSELQVNSNTPQAFIVHAKDDVTVPVENAIMYHDQLKASGVSSELFLYEKGGHGFGMHNKMSDVEWTALLATWMRKTGIIR
jgi:acetyl esterase/lipase